jgi:RNA polymerase-binding transcription factor DksA
MDQALIEEMKQELEKEKVRLEGELKGFTHREGPAGMTYSADFPSYGDKEEDNATEVAAYTDNLSLGHTLEGKLEDVVNALERIAKGTYGTCKYCGQEIDERRLKARPESASCVKCKTERLQRA